ncbi:potassium uptake system, Trk family protein [Candidatus Aerophobetes bacterium]|uniref:Potassium uptake system, Trk family protein n=1 Tax=Aerophobetes bacterium TaxID=2030807 RepID=A0A2A4YNH6_UNCAE|nr:MAG: potassium uptake system, Trk family protein [Candidatus Aerophobetes bacterium]
MRYKEIAKLLSFYLYCLSAILLIPLCVSIYYDFIIEKHMHPYPSSFEAFAFTFGFTIILALVFHFTSRGTSKRFHRKEALFLVVLVWIFSTIIGALPFIITKTLENPIDAYFESVSGFTTTGSSVILPKKYDVQTGEEIPYVVRKAQSDEFYVYYGTINQVTNLFTNEDMRGFAAIAKPILFWRSFIQWLGGIGIIFLFITILPTLNIGGKFLYEAESHPEFSEGSYQENLRPRIKQTASYLWKIYVGLTLVETLLLYFTNTKITFFEAVLTSFSTVSTGGFSITESGIGGYNSHPITLWIIILFMICGAINFGMYFHLITGKFKKLLNVELALFFMFIVVTVGLVVWKLSSKHDFAYSFMQGSFQTISALTCTGFSTANYDIWPFPCQAIMLVVMYIGGMTGSTSGGIKTARHITLFRAFKQKMYLLFKPDMIKVLKLGDSPIDPKSLNNVFIFFWVLVIASVLGTLLMIFDGIDLETAIGLTSCTINNVGLTFRMAGPGNTCAFLPVFSKIVAIVWMFLGRLEFFAILILLTPSFWKTR